MQFQQFKMTLCRPPIQRCGAGITTSQDEKIHLVRDHGIVRVPRLELICSCFKLRDRSAKDFYRYVESNLGIAMP